VNVRDAYDEVDMKRVQTLLLVDDDERVLNGLQRILRREPYRVLISSTADGALELLRAEEVDVVVSDEQMPGMTGSEFLGLLHQRFPTIITIMLSGEASMGSIIRSLNEGQIFRFLIKPCSPDHIIVNIRQALAQKRFADRCRLLVELCRIQADILSGVKARYPGLVAPIAEEVIANQAPRNGAADDATALIERIESELKRSACTEPKREVP
jgi:two-component system probable response regulator PhcQ